MKALVATGRWRSEKSASRYVHAPSGEVRDRLDALPKLGKIRELQKPVEAK
jgi:hypothetical protein